MVPVVLVLARSRLVQMSLEIRISIYTCVFWHKLHTAVTNRRGTDRRMHVVRRLTGVLSNMHDYSCSYGPMKRGHIPVLFVSGVMFSSFSSSSFTLSRNTFTPVVSSRTCSLRNINSSGCASVLF